MSQNENSKLFRGNEMLKKKKTLNDANLPATADAASKKRGRPRKPPAELKPENETALSEAVAAAVSYRSDASEQDKRKYQFIILHKIFALPVSAAAVKAGLTLSHAYKVRNNFEKHKSFRSKIEELAAAMPERYKLALRLKLPELYEAEAAAIDIYRQNPEKLIDKPKLARDLKIAAGALEPEIPPAPMINVNVISQLIKGDFNCDGSKQAPGEIQCDDVIDVQPAKTRKQYSVTRDRGR